MLKKVTIAENPLSPETWETVETKDLCRLLAERFDSFPEHGRIYHGEPCDENDVTPKNETDIGRLQSLEGEFYVVIYPAAPVIIVGIFIAAIVIAIVLAQNVDEPPQPMLRKNDNSSPNNELSKRNNRARINGRIPDIFGTVRAVPDLIAPSYTLYQDNIEEDHALMCVGRGSYEIPESGVREGPTAYTEILGSTVEIFGSGVLPLPISEKQLVIGEPLAEAFVATVRNNAVNGQTLIPFTGEELVGSNNIGFGAEWRENSDNLYFIGNNGFTDFRNFVTPESTLEITNGDFGITQINFDASNNPGRLEITKTEIGIITTALALYDVTLAYDYSMVQIVGCEYKGFSLDGVYRVEKKIQFGPDLAVLQEPELVNPNWGFVDHSLGVGDIINESYTKLQFAGTANTVNIDGEYKVGQVTANRIYLESPNGVSTDWDNIIGQKHDSEAEFLAYVNYQSPTLDNLSGSATGPFLLDDPETSEVIVNFTALNGLYKDDGTTQTPVDVTMKTTIQPVDANGDDDGDPETFDTILNGSEFSKGRQSVTGRYTLQSPSRCKVACQRTTPYVIGFTGQVSEEVKWIDLYGSKPLPLGGFGDVTLARVKRTATVGATSASGPEFNLLATRKIPKRVSGSEFTTELFPTSRADEIFSFIALDSLLGNRSAGEMDFDNIYSAIAEVETYFGSTIATEFNYTFDSDNLSFEEMAASVAKVVFCTAYRQGNQIKLTFERETENSTLLFNHRNKLPGSETRTVRFGNQNDIDGVEFEYVDPEDDSIKTVYLPNSGLINPQRVDLPGIRNKLQAHFHAWRLWNKARYQHIATEFQATQEADLLVLGDRILNADNTRPNIQDGEVVGQGGLELELSQKVEFAAGAEYVIFLQAPDGTIETIGVSAGTTDYKVVLANAPTNPLSLDPDNFARTTYLITETTEQETSAFIVVEKQPSGNLTSTVTGINYDSRYYDNDKDFENGIVDENGNPT